MKQDFSIKNIKPFLLFPDEMIIFKTNPHWLLLAVPVGSLMITWLLYLLFLCPYIIGTPLKIFCYMLSFFSFPFALFIFYLDWRFNRIYLTNFRLTKERGIIGQKFMSIFLEQTEDITVSYGFWGRIFGFGDLEIESAGTYGKMLFKGIPNPLFKKWQIECEIKKNNPSDRSP